MVTCIEVGLVVLTTTLADVEVPPAVPEKLSDVGLDVKLPDELADSVKVTLTVTVVTPGLVRVMLPPYCPGASELVLTFTPTCCGVAVAVIWLFRTCSQLPADEAASVTVMAC